jgi:uncharacterized protein YaeQ
VLTPLALTATIFQFDIELADADRGVYDTLALRVAQHPSESTEYLVTRVLAYALEFAEGIGFSRGVSEPDEPTIAIRDLTGAIKTWIEIGSPDAARLHKASKSAPRVAAYTHKDPQQLLRNLAGERIHKAESIEIYAIDRALVRDLAARLDRRMAFSMSVAEQTVYVSIGDETLTGVIARVPFPAGG